MKQLVFYWRGDDILIPSTLVKSIRASRNFNLNTIQISDQSTQKVDGVDEVIRVDKSENILMDRLYGYSLIDTKNNETIFLDADSIILKHINLNNMENGKYLYKRNSSQLFNSKYNSVYPELANKQTLETMPFLAGLIFIIREKNFFIDLFSISKDLPQNLKKWFGDQYILKKYYDSFPDNFKIIDNTFLKVVETNKNSKKINLSLNNDYTIVTFKGVTKKYMQGVFEAMIKNNFYNKD